jgi:hypothetical protein
VLVEMGENGSIGSLCLMGAVSVSFRKKKCTDLFNRKILSALNCKYKMFKMANFMLYILYQTLKRKLHDQVL